MNSALYDQNDKVIMGSPSDGMTRGYNMTALIKITSGANHQLQDTSDIR